MNESSPKEPGGCHHDQGFSVPGPTSVFEADAGQCDEEGVVRPVPSSVGIAGRPARRIYQAPGPTTKAASGSDFGTPLLGSEVKLLLRRGGTGSQAHEPGVEHA